MNNEELITKTIQYINKEYYKGDTFCQGQSIYKLVSEVQSLIGNQSETTNVEVESISGDVSPAESETGHYTSGGVDDEKELEGFEGFANGAD